MSLYRRNSSGPYWVDITIPSGRRIRKSTGTKDKQAAKELHDSWRTQAWRTLKLGEKPDYVWQDAVKQWFKDKKGKTSLDKDKMICRGVRKDLDGVKLKDISRKVLAEIAERKAKETSEATANRHMDLIRAILHKAADEWEMLEKAPKVFMFSVKTKRIRYLTKVEAERLIKHAPEHLKPMIRFSLATGLRHSNVTQLKWSQIDMALKTAWIHPDEAKAKKAIGVPLNSDAIEVLKKQLGKHDEFVFAYNGKSIKRANTDAFRHAVKRAGLVDFRWHDLRHTWASWHVQSGTDLHVLQEMGGWESIEMVKRYAHLSTKHLVNYAEKIVSHDTSTSQSDISAVG